MTAVAEGSAAPFRLLLVEDNPEEIELCRRAMDAGGFHGEVLVARDGVEALDLIAKLEPQRPDVVFLDLKLPRLDGIDVLRELKSHPERRTMPVVVLTSSNEHRDLEACYRLGANSYVVKPLDPDAFADAIGRLAGYWSRINHSPR